MSEAEQGSTGSTFLGEVGAALGAVENAIVHPIDTIEGAAGDVVAGVEAAGAAVVVEVEDLAEKVRKYFDTTSTGHLQDALLAIVDRLTALEARVAASQAPADLTALEARLASLEGSLAKVSDFLGK